MDEQLKKNLEDAIKKRIEELDSSVILSSNSSEKIEELSVLCQLYIDMVRVELGFENDAANNYLESEHKKALISEQIKERYFKLGIETASIVIPMMFYAAWMKRGFKFEETGTYTSTTFRGLFNRFKPTK